MTVTPITMRILGQNLPGLHFCDHHAVHVGVQRATREDVLDPVPGDAADATFAFTINIVRGDDGHIDFRGPFVQGKRGARFVYLSWGDLLPDGRFEMFRRAKIQLTALAEMDVVRAPEASTAIEAVVDLTGPRGGPVCAALRPPQIRWRMAGPA
jgi:Family of unknown function (DUF5990)